MKHSSWWEWVLRLLSYLVLAAGAAITPRFALQPRSADPLFTESTLVEGAQLMVLVSSVLLLCAVARQSSEWRRLSIVLALALFCALVRELDFYLDRLADGTWQLLVTLLLAAIVSIIWRDREALQRSLSRMTASTGFGLMLAGGLTTGVFSRLFGQGAFWEAVMGDNYMRSVKNAVEETTELLGYTLILIGVIEFALWIWRRAHEPDALRSTTAP